MREKIRLLTIFIVSEIQFAIFTKQAYLQDKQVNKKLVSVLIKNTHQ
jgi:hypothetical protein